MSWKSYCWLGLICSALLGCSSENADTNSPIIFTQLKALFLGIHASERIDPRKVITRTMIDQSSTPLILVDVLNSDQVATMEAFPGNTLFEVWLGADGSTVTTQNGLLVATRGTRWGAGQVFFPSRAPQGPHVKQNTPGQMEPQICLCQLNTLAFAAPT